MFGKWQYHLAQICALSIYSSGDVNSGRWLYHLAQIGDADMG